MLVIGSEIQQWQKNLKIIGIYEATRAVFMEIVPLTKEKRTRILKKQLFNSGDLPNDLTQIAQGVTSIFSPRPTDDMLDFYGFVLDSPQRSAYITLAFGISDVFKKYLMDNTANNHLVFMLLEKRDKPTETNRDTFIKINATNNVYKANGSFIRDPLYQ